MALPPIAPAALTAVGAPQRCGRRRSRLCATRYRGRAVAGVILVSDGGDTSGAGGARGRGWPADLRHRRRLTGGGQGSRDPRRHRRRDDPGRLARRPGGVGGQPRAGKRADRASAARERPFHRRQARDAGRRGIARARSVSGLARQRRADGLHRRDAARSPASSCPRTTPAAFSCQPPARARRVLLVEGAPGFEHSFLKRAWASDAGLEIDSVVRKGKNEQGADTFYIQAAQSRERQPRDGLSLDARGALPLRRTGARQRRGAPVHARASSRRRARFVGERGGGLLVLGARSFLRQGLAGSMLEDVLPLELNAGGGSASIARRASDVPAGANVRGRESRVPDPGRRGASHHAARGARRRYAEAMGGRAGARGHRAARRAAPRRERARGDERARRHATRARGRAALWRRPVDGLYRRGLVAVAHAAARGRSLVRHVLEAGAALAGACRRRDPIQLTVAAWGVARRARCRSRVVVAQRRVRAAAECHRRRARHRAGRHASRRCARAAGLARERTGPLRRRRSVRSSAGVFKLSADVAAGRHGRRVGDRLGARRRRRRRDDRPAAERGASARVCRGVGRAGAVRGSRWRAAGHAEGSRAGSRAGGPARSLAHRLVVCGDTDAARRRVDAAADDGGCDDERSGSGPGSGLGGALVGFCFRRKASVPSQRRSRSSAHRAAVAGERYALIVAGASGGQEYAAQYAAWTARSRRPCSASG